MVKWREHPTCRRNRARTAGLAQAGLRSSVSGLSVSLGVRQRLFQVKISDECCHEFQELWLRAGNGSQPRARAADSRHPGQWRFLTRQDYSHDQTALKRAGKHQHLRLVALKLTDL